MLVSARRVRANATEGSYTVTASVAGVTGSAAFTLTNTPGVVTTVDPAAGWQQSMTIGAVTPESLQAVVRDASGNGVGGVSVMFSAPACSASGAFTGNARSVAVTTNSNGVATAPAFTANSMAGSYTVTASVSGIIAPARFNLINLPGPATHFTLSLPATVQAGKLVSFTVAALDSGNNTATAYTGTVHFTSTDLAATLPTAYTFQPGDSGTHTFSATLNTVGGKSVTATDNGSPAITGSQSTAVQPVVTAITPLSGPAAGGGTVTMVGIGLTGATGVTVGGAACTNVSVNGSGTSLTCKLPTNQPVGSVDVVVATPNGAATLSHGYTFLPVTMQPTPVGRTGGGGGGGAGSVPNPVPNSR